MTTRPERLRQLLHQHRLVAILRAHNGDHLIPATRTLLDAGLRCIEITLPTPGSLAAIHAARTAAGDGTLIGAGTVLTPGDVRRAAEAGADFIVCPHSEESVLATANDLGLGSLPGAFTPTEALHASRLGATAVKLFPAGSLSPAYLTALAGPLPHLPFVPTGGITIDSASRWLAAGAIAVAVGSPLLGDALSSGDLDQLHTRARAFVSAVERRPA
ncbi:bifunctional 4-hydroxy-2-oxoglutarate aldolase/2-dehydro-3-deoxy-phosphogluconate aldolase [Streptomyces sp. NPDC051976]|uniref:bifunctional 4-hydroxy-2-oxoglutarate aldolase/2-dehydro-3-deoxy-phosphogluconate aldolase n=1 Tax=Streptomyces sp. NPDC051976 TaxID=3154947 RepID=UPI0034499C9C